MQIRLPMDLQDALVAAADERGLPVNFLVAAAIRDFLPRLIPADEFKLTRDPDPSWEPEPDIDFSDAYPPNHK